MDPYEEKLKAWIKTNQVSGEHLVFEQSCHSVEAAAKAVDANPSDFVKNICLMCDGSFVVAIIPGPARVDFKKVAGATSSKEVRMADKDEVLKHTGYPAGGTPSFGYAARFLIDPAVMEKQIVYTGGGSTNSVISVTPQEIRKHNKGEVLPLTRYKNG